MVRVLCLLKIDKFPDAIEAHNISEYIGNDYVTPTRDVIVTGVKYATENTKNIQELLVYRSNNKTNYTWVARGCKK